MPYRVVLFFHPPPVFSSFMARGLSPGATCFVGGSFWKCGIPYRLKPSLLSPFLKCILLIRFFPPPPSTSIPLLKARRCQSAGLLGRGPLFLRVFSLLPSPSLQLRARSLLRDMRAQILTWLPLLDPFSLLSLYPISPSSIMWRESPWRPRYVESGLQFSTGLGCPQ